MDEKIKLTKIEEEKEEEWKDRAMKAYRKIESMRKPSTLPPDYDYKEDLANYHLDKYMSIE